MICTTCKAEFCWTCLGPWEPHGSSWYHCNRFDEVDAQSARSAQAVSLYFVMMLVKGGSAFPSPEISLCLRKVSVLLQ